MTESIPQIQPDTRQGRSTFLSLVDWGIGFFVPFVLAVLIGLPVMLWISGISFDDFVELGEDVEFSNGSFLVAALIQQVLGLLGAFWVIKFGFGPIKNWKLGFKWSDLLIGLSLFPLLLGLVAATSWLVSQIVGLEELPSNTDIVSDASGSAWLILAIFVAVIGAPVSEEIALRGMTLRIFEGVMGRIATSKIFVNVFAVVFSSAVFALLHAPDQPGFDSWIVLVTPIFVLGCALAAATLVFDRIGPAIMAHAYFNGFAVVALLLFEEGIDPGFFGNLLSSMLR